MIGSAGAILVPGLGLVGASPPTWINFKANVDVKPGEGLSIRPAGIHLGTLNVAVNKYHRLPVHVEVR